jgi:hypothetical protein
MSNGFSNWNKDKNLLEMIPMQANVSIEFEGVGRRREKNIKCSPMTNSAEKRDFFDSRSFVRKTLLFTRRSTFSSLALFFKPTFPSDDGEIFSPTTCVSLKVGKRNAWRNVCISMFKSRLGKIDELR